MLTITGKKSTQKQRCTIYVRSAALKQRCYTHSSVFGHWIISDQIKAFSYIIRGLSHLRWPRKPKRDVVLPFKTAFIPLFHFSFIYYFPSSCSSTVLQIVKYSWFPFFPQPQAWNYYYYDY